MTIRSYLLSASKILLASSLLSALLATAAPAAALDDGANVTTSTPSAPDLNPSPPAAPNTQPNTTPDTKEGKEQRSVQTAGDSSKNLINLLFGSGKINKDLRDEALATINEIIKTARTDQNSIYLFVRTVNRNLDRAGPSCNCENFIASIRDLTRELMVGSYTDGLFQNGHLSNQVQTRLPYLTADSYKLTTPDGAELRTNFEEELSLLTERFMSSKRFRAGVGVSYAYLPEITYTAAPRVDFSPYQSASSGGDDLVLFNTQFRDRSVPALLLSARVPLLQLDIAIPNAKHSKSTTTTVQQRPGDSNNDLLARTTITSELSIDYDASLKLYLGDLYDWWLSRRGTQVSNVQYDFGIGIGMTGFVIKDDTSTDVRFRTDPASVFNDLAPGATITSTNSSAFNTVFFSLYYTFKVSDEFHVGLETRHYRSGQSSNSEVQVDGATMALNAVWYPTFNW